MVDHDEASAFARAAGNVLRTARRQRRWTQTETGSQAGLSASVLCRTERGARPLDLRRLVGLCAVLEVPPVWVIGVAQNEAFPFGWPGSRLWSPADPIAEENVLIRPAPGDVGAAVHAR